MARIEIKKKNLEELTAGALETEGSIEVRLRDDESRNWVFVADDAELPEGGAVVVTLKRLPEAAQLNRFEGLGVRVAAGEDIRLAKPYLGQIGIVELEFPKFRDGRNYSSARILREQLGYTGEIKAVGDVLADQLFFMIRCGIDCLALHPSVKEETARRALDRYKFVYQQASDDRQPVWALRTQGA